jgi:hypothetical protein
LDGLYGQTHCDLRRFQPAGVHPTPPSRETHNLASIMSNGIKGGNSSSTSAPVVALASNSLGVMNDANNDVVYEGWLLKKKRKKMQGL